MSVALQVIQCHRLKVPMHIASDGLSPIVTQPSVVALFPSNTSALLGFPVTLSDRAHSSVRCQVSRDISVATRFGLLHHVGVQGQVPDAVRTRRLRRPEPQERPQRRGGQAAKGTGATTFAVGR